MGIAVATYTECVFVLAGQHYTYICTQKTESRQNTEMLEHQKTINMCILHWHWGYFHSRNSSHFYVFYIYLYLNICGCLLGWVVMAVVWLASGIINTGALSVVQHSTVRTRFMKLPRWPHSELSSGTTRSWQVNLELALWNLAGIRFELAVNVCQVARCITMTIHAIGAFLLLRNYIYIFIHASMYSLT